MNEASAKDRVESALIALGSNLGESPQILRNAIERLRAFSKEPVRESSMWQTTPVDCPPGSPLFVNAVVELVPVADETPESLLKKLQALEKEFGRQKKKTLNEPRPLDLDLIAFGQQTRATGTLTLPHPRAHERAFVLAPLCEVAPDFVLPGQVKAVKTLLAELSTPEQLFRL